MTAGRGAFGRAGKGNQASSSYTAEGGSTGKWDGQGDTHDINVFAVNAGVRAIQHRIIAAGYRGYQRIDGIFGPATGEGVAWLHGELGSRYLSGKLVTASGRDRYYFGPTAGRYAWTSAIGSECDKLGAPADILWGIMIHESGGDPGAVGITTPGDCGLFQINTLSTGATRAQAHDVVFAIPYSVKRFRGAMSRYAPGVHAWQTKDLQIRCSIGQHFWPVGADSWYRTGRIPATSDGTKMAEYARNVIEDIAPLMPTG